MTFLPPSAPMVVPLRAALGAIEPWEIVLSASFMVAAIWVLFVVGARVYSGAVLQTGGRMKLRDAWRAPLTAAGLVAGRTSPTAEQPTTWSLTRPADCMSA